MLERRQRYVYGRRGTPTIEALASAVSDLEGAAGTVLCPSGLSAISTALLSCVSAGDHVLMADCVYAPSRHFADVVLKRLGVETTYFDPAIGAGIAALFGPRTRVVYLESPGSLTFEMQDVPAIAALAHAHGAVVIADNTWATPLYLQAARARRRPVRAGGDQVSRRARRRHARHRRRQRRALAGARGNPRRFRTLRRPGRHLPRAARHAHARRAARPADALRYCRRRMAGRAAGGRARSPSGARRPIAGMRCGSAT